MDNTVFTIEILTAALALIGIVYSIIAVFQIIKKKRKREISFAKASNYILGFVDILPLLCTEKIFGQFNLKIIKN
jgi:hypothetical protein